MPNSNAVTLQIGKIEMVSFSLFYENAPYIFEISTLGKSNPYIFWNFLFFFSLSVLDLRSFQRN